MKPPGTKKVHEFDFYETSKKQEQCEEKRDIEDWEGVAEDRLALDVDVDLEALVKLQGPPMVPICSTVEYVNENDPEEGVVFKNKNGTPVMWMPTEDYFALKEKKQ